MNQPEPTRPTAKSLFEVLSGKAQSPSTELLNEVKEEIAKDKADKIKSLLHIGARVYESQSEELSRFRQRVAQVEKKLKNGLKDMTELTEKLIAGDQEVIDNYENRLVTIRAQSRNQATMIIADMPLMKTSAGAHTGSGSVNQQNLGGLVERKRTCDRTVCAGRLRPYGADLKSCTQSVCPARI